MYPMNSTGELTTVQLTGTAAAVILGTIAVLVAAGVIWVRWAMRQARQERQSRAHRRELRMAHAEFNEIVRDLLR
jgi:uncharacterized membrane protein YqjE